MIASVSQVESEYFNNHVAQAGEFNPFTPAGWETLGRRFAEWLPFQEQVDLLDVGCGTGQSKQVYDPSLRSYTGIDLSTEAIRQARHNHPDGSWVRGDACQLPFGDQQFDVVAFSSVLHHIPHFESALKEAARVLKPNGWAFAFDPNILHPAMALFRHRKSPFYNPNGVSPNEQPLLRARCGVHFRRLALAGSDRGASPTFRIGRWLPRE